MRRLLLGISLASTFVFSGGCCCWQGSGWTPCPWPGCGWGCESGWNGGGGGCGDCGDCGSCCGGWGGWFGWPCNRPGGCGEMYWGDWCTGDPHCHTCDGCGNWIGPPSPGGGGVPPEVYGHHGPYGQQVARNSTRNSPSAAQMARTTPPRQYNPQMMARRTNQRVYGGRMMPSMGPQFGPQMSRSSGPQMGRPMGPQFNPQMAQRGETPQEYEGAIQYLGTTDRLVKPAELPTSRNTSSAANIARRGEPTLADPRRTPEDAPQVRRASRQYVR